MCCFVICPIACLLSCSHSSIRKHFFSTRSVCTSTASHYYHRVQSHPRALDCLIRVCIRQSTDLRCDVCLTAVIPQCCYIPRRHIQDAGTRHHGLVSEYRIRRVVVLCILVAPVDPSFVLVLSMFYSFDCAVLPARSLIVLVLTSTLATNVTHAQKTFDSDVPILRSVRSSQYLDSRRMEGSFVRGRRDLA